MRNALVVGGSSGLGLASAQAILNNGDSVCIVGRQEDRLQDAKNCLGVSNVETAIFDMSVDSEVQQFCSTNQNHPDILVLNAGGPPPGPCQNLSRTELEKAIQTHLYSSIRLVDWALPKMIENKFGRIVAITSITAKSLLESMALSNIVRGAVQNWLKTLSREIAAHGITVNCALPGYTMTSRIDELFSLQSKSSGRSRDEIETKILAQIPAKRFGNPNEFGEVVGFLCSERSSFVTGQAIAIDGGWTQGV